MSDGQWLPIEKWGPERLTRSSVYFGRACWLLDFATGDHVVTQPSVWGFPNTSVWRFILFCILCSCGFIPFFKFLCLFSEIWAGERNHWAESTLLHLWQSMFLSGELGVHICPMCPESCVPTSRWTSSQKSSASPCLFLLCFFSRLTG